MSVKLRAICQGLFQSRKGAACSANTMCQLLLRIYDDAASLTLLAIDAARLERIRRLRGLACVCWRCLARTHALQRRNALFMYMMICCRPLKNWRKKLFLLISSLHFTILIRHDHQENPSPTELLVIPVQAHPHSKKV